jgi:predicted dehydrogenase
VKGLGEARVAIVGCGLVGRKRAQALGRSRLVAAADVDGARAEALAADFPGCAVERDWARAVTRPDVDVVIVATVHDALAEIALAAVRAGKHVLVEKPGARRPAELLPVRDAAAAAGLTVKVGFNHRLHPGIRKARAIAAEGALGPVLYLRGRYGHGGRPGYEKEWRADPVRSGGGELLDQGVHLIDLARCFADDFALATAHLGRFYWDMPVEDNAFLQLKTAAGQVAWLHASWTEWKNLFCFEVFCRGGKLQVDGLGGSYGAERLTVYRMLPEMGPPETAVSEFAGADGSWALEFEELLAATRGEATGSAGIDDALAALAIVEHAYAGGAA